MGVGVAGAIASRWERRVHAMGMGILGEVLKHPEAYEPDMVVYIPEDAEEITLFTPVLIVQHGSYGLDDVCGYRYLLEAGVMVEVIDGMRTQLQAEPTLPQRLRAILYYAEHDAFPDIKTVR
jgi:hypothetical protein